MTAHFLYFILCGIRNAAHRQARRLRQPRYAVAALVGVAYFVFLFGGWAAGGDDVATVGASFVEVGRAVGPLFIGLLAAWWWLWGGHRNAIALLPAETNLLLTAPITRRQLIRFKIMQAQVPTLVSSLIGTLFLRGSGLPWPLRLLSLWIMLSTLHQHQVAASLVHASAEQHGARGFRRNAVPVVLFGVAFLALMVALMQAIADVRAAPSVAFAGERLLALLQEPGPRIALAPFRLLLAPTLASSVAEWSTAFAAAVLVLVAHYLWVQRSDAAFEEAAIEEGARRAERIQAMKSGGLARLRFTSIDRPRQLARPLLPLDATHNAAYAVFWKNVLYVQRSVRPLSLVLIAAWLAIMVVLIGSAADDAAQALGVYGGICLIFAAIITVGGPLAFRNDLRMDLRYVDLLRTYPIRGRDMVIAQILACTVAVTSLQFAVGGIGLALYAAGGKLAPLVAVAAALAGLVALPIINALAVGVQNAIVLFYPGWVRIGESGSGGMETIGQNVLTLIFTLVLLALAAIPPLIVGVVVGAPFVLVGGAGAVLVGGAAALATVAGELYLLSLTLGRVYDSMDPVEAGLLR